MLTCMKVKVNGKKLPSQFDSAHGSSKFNVGNPGGGNIYHSSK